MFVLESVWAQQDFLELLIVPSQVEGRSCQLRAEIESGSKWVTGSSSNETDSLGATTEAIARRGEQEQIRELQIVFTVREREFGCLLTCQRRPYCW